MEKRGVDGGVTSIKNKKTSIHNNKFGFWLSDMDHYKNKYSKKSPTKKPKVAETSETAEIIELSKTKVKRD